MTLLHSSGQVLACAMMVFVTLETHQDKGPSSWALKSGRTETSLSGSTSYRLFFLL